MNKGNPFMLVQECECDECIVKPCCTQDCNILLVYVNKGKKAAKEFAKQGGWNSPEQIEYECGLRGSGSEWRNLSDYYLQVSDDGTEIKAEKIAQLKKKKIEVAQIVHGRLFIDEQEAYILPHNRLGVNIDNLG